MYYIYYLLRQQLQEQAFLVLQENQALNEQLEAQHLLAKETQSKHHSEGIVSTFRTGSMQAVSRLIHIFYSELINLHVSLSSPVELVHSTLSSSLGDAVTEKRE